MWSKNLNIKKLYNFILIYGNMDIWDNLKYQIFNKIIKITKILMINIILLNFKKLK